MTHQQLLLATVNAPIDERDVVGATLAPAPKRTKRQPGTVYANVTDTPAARTAKEFEAAIHPAPAACFGGYKPNSDSGKLTLKRKSRWSQAVYNLFE
jgi:hypothetical protein